MAEPERDREVRKAVRLEVVILALAAIAVIAADPQLADPWRGIVTWVAIAALFGSLLYLILNSVLIRVLVKDIRRVRRPRRRWSWSSAERQTREGYGTLALFLDPPRRVTSLEVYRFGRPNPYADLTVKCTVRRAGITHESSQIPLELGQAEVNLPLDFQPALPFPPLPYGRYRVRWFLSSGERVHGRRYIFIGVYGLLQSSWRQRLRARYRRLRAHLRDEDARYRTTQW